MIEISNNYYKNYCTIINFVIILINEKKINCMKKTKIL